MLKTIFTDIERPESLSFSPCGNYLAKCLSCKYSESDTNSISIYSVTNRFALVKTLLSSNNNSILNEECIVVFSPDGKYLVGSVFQGITHVWSTKDWEMVKSFDATDNNSQVSSISFNKDGSIMAIGTELYRSDIILWNTLDWSITNRLSVQLYGANCITFNPINHNQLVSVSIEHIFNVCNISENKIVRQIKITYDGINAISFSRDGKYLASGSHAGNIRIWLTEKLNLPLPNGEICQTEGYDILMKQEYGVFDLLFTIDDKYLITAGGDRSIRFYSTSDWKLKKVLYRSDASIYALACSPDGNYLAAGSFDDKCSSTVWTLCKWSDRNNTYFSDNINSIVFYIMCLFEMRYFDEIPMEMLLEMIDFIPLIINLTIESVQRSQW